ncbi:MAG: hypothetical protein RLZZ555_2254, partial [Pseudomonadota bacterium]
AELQDFYHRVRACSPAALDPDQI